MTALTTRRTFAMLDNESLWQLAERVDAVLAEAGIPYAIVGGVAVALHGYRRFTHDLDVMIRREEVDGFRERLEAEGMTPTPLSAGERSIPTRRDRVRGSQPSVRFLEANQFGPDTVTEIEGLRVLTLAELIQSKIACGLGNLRRTHKDFADVVELAAFHKLDGSFARFLHKSVRPEFRALAKRAQG